MILKPNRGGKGLGVRLFHTAKALAGLCRGRRSTRRRSTASICCSNYVRSPDALITRAEFIGGRFFYAVEVDTSDGFELCPADVCAVGDAFCPVGRNREPKFTIVDDIDRALKARATRPSSPPTTSSRRHRVHPSTQDGAVYTYDVNTNTNYNPDAEARAGRSA